MRTKFDACEYCGGQVRSRQVTVDLHRGEKLCIFRRVPIGVCTKCGEHYYPGPVLERLDEIAKHGINGAKKVQVPSIDFADVGT